MRNSKAMVLLVTFLFSGLLSIAQITEFGLASFYADKFDGRVTASGAIFDQNKLTAAHRTFPFGTTVKVTNMKNNKTVIVVINDRGPFVKDRVIDLSQSAAKKLDYISAGVAQVKVEVIDLGKSEFQNYTSPKPASPQSVKPLRDKPASEVSAVAAIPISTEAAQNISVEYYKLESELIKPTGYGIQIASYQEAANLMKRCDEIRKDVHKNIIIQVGESNGGKVYRIIVGPFENRDAASHYQNDLKKVFTDSFIVAF